MRRGPVLSVWIEASVNPRGKLRNLGLTELFFETNEPLNTDVPIPQVLANLPAGTYDFETIGRDGNQTLATSEFTTR